VVPILLLTIFPVAKAQDPPPVTASQRAEDTGAPLRSGSNEFGVWTGFSPFSFHFVGASDGRKLYLLNFQYARTLFVTRKLTFKYTAEIVPVALEIQPKQKYYNAAGIKSINPAGTIYGAGPSPIGIQANFGRRRIQPFLNGSLGFVYFRQQVPVLGSAQFNYTATMGVGAQFFRRPGRSFTVGWKYDHMSNKYQAPLNPGIDSSVFYVGFSIFREDKR
jgi:hypothetical protein